LLIDKKEKKVSAVDHDKQNALRWFREAVELLKLLCLVVRRGCDGIFQERSRCIAHRNNHGFSKTI